PPPALNSFPTRRSSDLSAELVLEHRRRPSLETIRDDRPGRLESEDELACHTWVGRVVFPALAARIVERRAFGTRLFEDVAEPVRSEEHTSELQSRGHLV